MTPQEFRRHAHEVVDWIAGYLEDPGKYPVLAAVEPGRLIDALPCSAPETGEPFEAMFADFEKLVLPGITHWNHPGFMAYFSITGSAPGILGEMLIAALNVNGMLWKTSPSATELEQVSLGWLRQWLGLPEEFFGIVYDTASISTMHAIAAAREAADPEARTRGARPGLTLYTSEHAHSSVEKGAIALGIGQQYVRKIASDDRFRMRVDLLEQAMERDRADGLRPFCVSATIGTTSTTSVDPVNAMADVAARYGAWLHVDAAYAGSTAVLPECRWAFEGIERADSMVTNPHKWLFTPTDFSAFFTRRPEILRRAFSLVPEYLRTADHPRAVNMMDYGVQLGRRFRALKFWFVLRSFGREGVVSILRRQIGWASEFASWVEADERFELAAPVPFSVICFRHKAGDDANRAIMERVNASGDIFISHTALNGRIVLRVALGNAGTTGAHVERAWQLIQEAAAAL